MNLPEVAYRISQASQKLYEKKTGATVDHSKQNYHEILQKLTKREFSKVPDDLTQQFLNYERFDFFGLSINLKEQIDWHKDITFDSKFPLTFSKSIDTRSNVHGNAKIVWEFNRLQFLLPLAAKFSASKAPEDLDRFIAILNSWITENPYLKGVNWYSNIEVNIRLIVWYFCWQILWQTREAADNQTLREFTEKQWLPSIYEHCVYSYNNPSKYSSANNHLISEYAGLFVASSLWPFNQANKWRIYAQKGLEKEIILQHSKNGVNKEEAAEYIQFITDFFLIPYAVGKAHDTPFTEEYEKALYNIITYIYNLLDKKGNYCKYGDEDDGKVLVTSPDPHFNSFQSILTSGAVIFNNSDFKVAGKNYDFKNFLLWGSNGLQKFNELKAISTPKKSIFLEEEGHFIFRKETDQSEIYMHFDVAPLGFLSIAAHGHADSLAFNLTVDGCPFIIDSGTYTYYSSPKWRKYFLSTIAHNTLCIDYKDQAYLAGPTMWLNHYTSEVLKTETGNKVELVSGRHNGYKDIGCIHTRTIIFNKENESFKIEDEVEVTAGTHIIKMPFHIHPEVTIEKDGENEWILTTPACTKKIKLQLDPKYVFGVIRGEMNPPLGWYSPSFVVKQPCAVIIGTSTIKQTEKFNSIIEIV
jgi:hypothetical protein